MADITISDLELAPALTDDMVLPVENTTDTYAATLAMLRRLINKTFVEVENADFNALTDDGYYQCTGTPTNSPVAGAINWTLQVSAENGVVVQRAFSLDDNFANFYIRRWNGVTWTGWLEVGAGALANKANISLSNLSAEGRAKFDGKANVSLSNSPYTTNRILEIPQNIKLELNNGTLTLKAGSKVYVPNGFEADGTTPKFDAIVIPSDYVYNADFGINHSSLLSFGIDGKGVGLITSSWRSGTTAPTSDQFILWYDTNTNKIKWTADYGTTWTEWSICLPIARITIGDTYNVITSIDQVFNGFGYIGSTVFALPGVKCEFPNGLNSDGTCRSIIATVDSVKTITRSDSITSNIHWYLTSNFSTFSSNVWSFDADKNIYVGPSGVMAAIEIAHGYLTSGKITSFEPFTVDSVLNSSLSNLSAAGQAKFDAKANVSQFQVVSALPANPDPNVFYFIPE